MTCSRCLKKVKQLYYEKGEPGVCQTCFFRADAQAVVNARRRKLAA